MTIGTGNYHQVSDEDCRKEFKNNCIAYGAFFVWSIVFCYDNHLRRTERPFATDGSDILYMSILFTVYVVVSVVIFGAIDFFDNDLNANNSRVMYTNMGANLYWSALASVNVYLYLYSLYGSKEKFPVSPLSTYSDMTWEPVVAFGPLGAYIWARVAGWI